MAPCDLYRTLIDSHNNRSKLMPRAHLLVLNLLLLCSRATAEPDRPELPPEVAINKEAGRGGHLVIALRLQSGEQLPFIVDTGSPITLLDASLAPRLGKRLDKLMISTLDGDDQKSGRYVAPKLFLGNTQLITGSNVATFRLAGRKGPPAMGILGMDCLRHYCIQLDFASAKMRFLDPDQVEPASLGQSFPIAISGGYPVLHHKSLAGGSTNMLIDLGCSVDGLAPKDAVKGLAVFWPALSWGGASYTNILLAAVDHANVLGLRFLARHLVTLNFPKRTMYLKQTSAGPLFGALSWDTTELGELGPPTACLEGLKKQGQLPGWSKNGEKEIYFETASYTGGKSLKSVTIGFRKDGDSSRYHYVVSRASTDSPWTMRKAWRTDQAGHTVEKYPVH
jgi:hypothetical protein